MAANEMSFRGVRHTKFRHVFGKQVRKEHCYENVHITRNAHDGCFCAVNPKFLAIVTESASGGAFVVIPLERTGRFNGREARVCGHRGAIMDIKWSPFDDHIIASCSEDCTVKLWRIPEEGLLTSLSDWIVDLQGHQKRVGYIEWHPTAQGIILSAAYDYKCILWNTETAEPITVISCHTDTVFCISWNRDGSLFSTTCKDKKIRVIDPRTGDTVAEAKGPQGPKASKVVFLGDSNRLFVVGFSRTSERMISLWDIKNMSEPLYEEAIDCSCGTLLPFYDPDTNIVFTAGKGDGNIRYFEILDTAPYVFFLNQYLSSDPQRGLGSMPKRGLDTSKNEIMRFYKLHAAKDVCEPIPMIVPRRSEEFQDDIYPPTASATPSLTADEWISGQNRGPILVSLKDGTSCNMPKITTAKAVQKKDLSKAPTVSTHHPGKQVAHSMEVDSKVKAKHYSTSSDDSAPPVPPLPKDEDLPASLKNIKKLSSVEQEKKTQVNGVHQPVKQVDNRIEVKTPTIYEKSPANSEGKRWTAQPPTVKMTSNKENEPIRPLTTEPLPDEIKSKGHTVREQSTSPGKKSHHPAAKQIKIVEASEKPSSNDDSFGPPSELSFDPSLYSVYTTGSDSFTDWSSSSVKRGMSEISPNKDAEAIQPNGRDTSPKHIRPITKSEEVSPRSHKDNKGIKHSLYANAKDVVLARANHLGEAPRYQPEMTEFEAFLTCHGNPQNNDEALVTSQTYINKPSSMIDDKPLVWSPKIPDWYNPYSRVEIVDTTPTVNEMLASKAQEQENIGGAVKSGEETHLVRPSQIMAMQKTGADAEDSWHVSPERYRTLDWDSHKTGKSRNTNDKVDKSTSVYQKPSPHHVIKVISEDIESQTSSSFTYDNSLAEVASTNSDYISSPSQMNISNSRRASSDQHKTANWDHYICSRPIEINEKSVKKAYGDASPTRNQAKLTLAMQEKMEPSSGKRRYDKSHSSDPKVHVRKTWMSSKTPDNLIQNGMPKTDPELRKAYFQQVEEMNSLKQQLNMKDKRIRQLEQELKEARQALQGRGHMEGANC